MSARRRASLWLGAAVLATALPSSAAGQTALQLAPTLPPGVSAESLLDPSVQTLSPTGWTGIQRESLLDGSIPEVDLPASEPQPNKRSFLTLEDGPFVFIFSGDASVTYNDNIFLAEHHPEADFLYTLTPRVMVGAGDYGDQKMTYLAAGLAPSLIIFQDHSGLSGTEYDSFIEGQYTLSRLRLGSRLSYLKLSGDDSDASGRIKRQIYTGEYNALYELSQSILIEVDGQWTHRDYRDRIDSDEYLQRAFLAYLLTPTVQVALGGTYGTFRPANHLNQNYEEPLLRLWYQASPKFSIRAIGGVDFRQFGEGISDRRAAVGDVTVVYLPSRSENTLLTLGGYRRVQNSVSDPTQNYLSNGIVAHVTQRVWHDLYLDLGGGYQHTTYYPVSRESVTPRQDGTWFIRPKVRYDFNSWGAVSVFCSWRNNDSTAHGNSWKNEQIGVELSVGF